MTATSDETKRQKELIRRFFAEVWSDATFDGLDEFVAPASTLHHRGRSVSLTPGDLVDVVSRWKDAFPTSDRGAGGRGGGGPGGGPPGP